MATVTKCDRCGAVYDNDCVVLSKINDKKVDRMAISCIRNSAFDTRVWFDLCPECVDSLSVWLDQGEYK